MLFSFKTREDLDETEEVISLPNQVEALRLQDELCKQNFQEDLKKCLSPSVNILKMYLCSITRGMTETSKEENKALLNLNDNVLEILNDRGILASYLLSLLCKIIHPDHTSQFKLAKDWDSNRVIDLLINKTIPVTLHDYLLTFGDTDGKFKLPGNLLKMIIKETIM